MKNYRKFVKTCGELVINIPLQKCLNFWFSRIFLGILWPNPLISCELFISQQSANKVVNSYNGKKGVGSLLSTFSWWEFFFVIWRQLVLCMPCWVKQYSCTYFKLKKYILVGIVVKWISALSLQELQSYPSKQKINKKSPETE